MKTIYQQNETKWAITYPLSNGDQRIHSLPLKRTIQPSSDRSIYLRLAILMFVVFCLQVNVTSAFSADLPESKQQAKRPNILWLSCEDISSHLGCYGYKNAITPNLDRLAKQGVRYSMAFTTTGVCATNRSSIITGMYPTSIGTQHMRCKAKLPKHIKCFTEYLREVGYYCTNNSKTDYNFPVPKNAWDANGRKAHWKNKSGDQPFFAVFNYTGTHESKVRANHKQFQSLTRRLTDKHRQNPQQLTLPPYYPDTKVTRKDWAHYYELITAMDYWIADKLNELEKAGLADDTIVVYWSDHGVGLPRAKRWVYDSGTRVPMIIRAGKNVKSVAPQIQAGKVDNQLIGFIDFAPTMLNLAGIKIPKHLQGRAFLGSHLSQPRIYIHSTRDRMDERYDLIRAVRDDRYRYIRNYMPEKTYYQFLDYAEKSFTMQELRRLHKEKKLSPTAALFMSPTKPTEEFYDLKNDPHEINNLVGSSDPQHQKALKRLRAEHLRWVFETRDLGLIVEPELVTKENQLGSRRAILQGQQGKILLQRLHTIATLEKDNPNSYDRLLTALDDQEVSVRCWAIRTLRNHKPWAEKSAKHFQEMLKDKSAIVRVEAACAVCLAGKVEHGLKTLEKELSDENKWVRLRAALVLDQLNERSRPSIAVMRKALKDKNKYVDRVISHALDQLKRKNYETP